MVYLQRCLIVRWLVPPSAWSSCPVCPRTWSSLSHQVLLAMSTFSPVDSRSSNDVCVCVCVCGRNELEVGSTLAYRHISSFRTRPLPVHTHTRILKPFEDSKPTVWILPYFWVQCYADVRCHLGLLLAVTSKASRTLGLLRHTLKPRSRVGEGTGPRCVQMQLFLQGICQTTSWGPIRGLPTGSCTDTIGHQVWMMYINADSTGLAVPTMQMQDVPDL